MGTSVSLKKVYAGLALGLWQRYTRFGNWRWCTYGSSRIKTARRRTCDLDWRLDNDGAWDFYYPTLVCETVSIWCLWISVLVYVWPWVFVCMSVAVRLCVWFCVTVCDRVRDCMSTSFIIFSTGQPFSGNLKGCEVFRINISIQWTNNISSVTKRLCDRNDGVEIAMTDQLSIREKEIRSNLINIIIPR